MRSAICAKSTLFFFLVFAFVGNALAADPVLENAKRFMAQKNPKAAYELLVPLQSARAGDPDYDFLLGLAALDSGKASEAVFALERVLAVNPNHTQARAEIARAYFVLGERQTAKQEFESVQKMGVPAGAEPMIQKFLDAIEQLAASERTQVRGYVELTLGHDTNVNSATSGSQVAIPAFGGAIFTLADAGVKQEDNFGSAGAGISVRHPLSKELALFGGLNLNKKINDTQDRFDTGSWDGNAGISLTRQKNVFTAAFQANNFYVDNSRFRDAYGVTGQWQHNYDARNQASAYLQYTELHYPGQEIRDARRYVGGMASAHAFAAKMSPVAYAGFYFGEERENAAGVPWLGHELFGSRLGGQVTYNDKTTVFANASIESRRYGGNEPFFLTTRKDTQYDLRIGVNYAPEKYWTVTPLVSFTHVDSNIQINTFRRNVFSVTVRRSF
ncbi:MAG: surface lipoprotein assembly modifier [Burkholderiales bacterium]|nr:surface lipoprotein assembly modifier [Burkholderiales bacterium]